MNHKEIVKRVTTDTNLVNLASYSYLRQLHGPSIGEVVVKSKTKIMTDSQRVKKGKGYQPAW